VSLTGRLRRLALFPWRNLSARTRWEYIGSRRRDAFHMMDGSASEEDLRRRGAAMAERFRRGLDIRPEHTVLEIGCGVARVGRELAPHCASYVGADISMSLLAIARERTAHLANVRLARLTGPGLEGVPEGRFDRVLCHLVFLHMDEGDIRARLGAVPERLAPRGLLYFDAWNALHTEVRALARREEADSRLRRQPHRSRFYTPDAARGWEVSASLAPVWAAASSFLLQRVATRGDAPGALSGQAPCLMPAEGRGLDFDP
jgi:SAM-dependent methyltransferase